MKDRIKTMIQKMKDDKGDIIVEATIVFPVMLFVLCFIIFIGNMYYEQAKIDDIVMRYAVKGAEYVADPSQYHLENGGSVPTEVNGLDIEPYRYILGSITNGSVSDIEDKISAEVKKEINDASLVFFSNSRARYLGTENDKVATFKTYVLYSTFTVQVNYEIKLPIRFMGTEPAPIFKFSSRAEVAVNDAPEFIRNIDMAVDLLDGTAISEKVTGFFDKIKSFINQFK